MKTYMKFLSILPLAVMFIATTFASSALASPPPFQIHGSFKSLETHINQGGPTIVDLDGVGHASVLGHYAVHEVATIAPDDSASGTADFLTASGDHIFTTSNNQVTPNEDFTGLNIVETHTITGGTGRFAGATGTITIERFIDLATLLSEGTITGTISLPAPNA